MDDPASCVALLSPLVRLILHIGDPAITGPPPPHSLAHHIPFLDSPINQQPHPQIQTFTFNHGFMTPRRRGRICCQGNPERGTPPQPDDPSPPPIPHTHTPTHLAGNSSLILKGRCWVPASRRELRCTVTGGTWGPSRPFGMIQTM